MSRGCQAGSCGAGVVLVTTFPFDATVGKWKALFEPTPCDAVIFIDGEHANPIDVNRRVIPSDVP